MALVRRTRSAALCGAALRDSIRLAAVVAMLLLAAAPARAQIALVQTTGLFGTPAGTSATSAALPANPTAGNVIVVLVWTWTQNRAPAVTVSDNVGNTYNAAAQATILQVSNRVNWYESANVFWTYVNSTGANFTVTVSLPGNDNTSQIRGVMSEYSGIGGLDRTGTATGATATASVSTTAATASTNELVVAAMGINNPAALFNSITPSAALTTRAFELQNSGDTAGNAGDYTAAATGVQTVSWTASPSLSGWAAVIATFFEAGSPGSGTAAGLNLVDGYFGTYPAASAGQRIYTKLAGTSFTLNMAALNNVAPTAGLTSPAYVSGSNKVTVDLVDDSDGACASSCGGNSCQSKSAVSSLTTSFATGDGSYKTGLSFNVARAYPNLRGRMKDSTTSRTVFGCSVDNFAVRPASLAVSSSASADATGASTIATPTVKAGNSFTITATAVAGYNGTPSLNPATLSANPSTAGTLTGSFAAANAVSGAATGNFTYNEVGYFQLGSGAVYDTGFTAVDQGSDCTADYSNALVSGKYGCYVSNTATTSYFGRFIPDHFAIAAGSITPACGTFTYFDQDGFVTTFTLTAQSASNSQTRNYTGSFAKLALNNWAGFTFTGDTATPAASATAPSGSWSNGAASVSAKHQVPARPTSTPVAPASLTLSARPSDSDGVTLAAAAAVMSSPTPIRFGVLQLRTAYGSNLTSLSVPVKAMYWNGSAFVDNAADSCTGAGLSNANVALGNLVQKSGTSGTFSTSIASTPSLSSTWSNGAGTITLAASSVAGTARLAVNLGAAAVDNSCIGWSVPSTGAHLAWLRGNWCGLGFASDPSALASFGTKSTPFVIFRENF
jgi:hypothetical protein